MTSHAEAKIYLAETNDSVRPIADAAHQSLVDLGCSSYVKTIYIGYDLGGEMVAALYGHADHVEIALALPEDIDGPTLVDGTHLTWRTLPVAAILRTESDAAAFRDLAALAVDRVRTAKHEVRRDNDFYVRRKRARLDKDDD